MKTGIYRVFDSVAKAYLQLMPFVTDEEAIRAFALAANNETHDFHKSAEDYSLFMVATDDNITGVITPCEPTCIARAHELKE